MSCQVCSPFLNQLIVASYVLVSLSTSAQSLFNKSFQYEGYMGCLEPVSGPDGFVICSNVRFGVSDEIDGFQFTRFDSSGGVLQTSAFSTGPLSYSMQHGALTRSRSNGTFSFLFGGFTALRIFNTTSSGSVNWNRMVRYVNPDYFIEYLGAMDQAFEEAPDGGYLITALRTVTDTIAPMIVKLDSTGNILWNKTYDLDETCGWHITSHVDATGTLLFGFHADTPYATVSDNNICTKVTTNGNTVWSKRVVGLAGRLTGCTMVDGRYVVSAADSSSIYVLNMDTTGVPLWGWRYALSFPLYTWGLGIIPTHDQGFVLTADMPGPGGTDVFFFKADSAGTPQWERIYGNTNHERFIDLVENGDSTFTLLTYTQLTQNWSLHYNLNRLDSMGMNDCMLPASGLLTETPFTFSMVDVVLDEFESLMTSQPLYVGDSTSIDPVSSNSCSFEAEGLDDLARPEDLQVYPNPTNGAVSVRITRNSERIIFNILDMLGRQVYSTALSSTETAIDLHALPSGIYLYRAVTTNDRTMSGRLIKE